MASSSGSQNKPPPPPVPPRPVMVPRPTMLQYEPHESLKISRCRFMVLVYLLFVVFLLLALIQWELVSYYKPLAHFFLANYWLSAVCMLISVPLLAVFLMVRKARYIPIFSWLLLCVIIELLVIGICTLAAYCSELNFLLYFTVTAILMVTCVLIGSFIPCDLTANVAVLFLVSIQLFLLSIFLLMTYTLIESGDAFFISFAVMIMLVIVYHVPCPTDPRGTVCGTIHHRWTLCRDHPLLSLLHYSDAFLLRGLVKNQRCRGL
ncbi:uncharacterized protein [Drosophila takahashii]|uniref:uncharacterized protein isoform X1 n=1 Tax=Drosophila takahashii TaxID=29030 RepID=UPI00389942FD